MRKILSLSFYIFIIFIFTSCYDNQELENRSFVITLGIDAVDENFLITLEIKNTDEDEKNIYLQSEGNTLLSAIEKINLTLDNELYFGQSKLLIFGKNLLENPKMLMQALDFFDRTTIINKKIIIVATNEEPEKIFDSEFVGSELGIYFSGYFKNRTHNGIKKSAENIISSLRVTNSCIIPKIVLEDDELKISGNYLLKDYKIVDTIDDETLLYYLIFNEDAINRIVTINFENKNIPLEIIKNKTDIQISEKNNKINITANIKINGHVEEFILENDSFDSIYLNRAEEVFAKKIESEISEIYDIFYNEYNCDELKLLEHIRKFNYDIYENMIFNNDDVFSDLEFEVNADIAITNTGTKK